MGKRLWSVVLERTVRELQGTSCFELDHAPQPKQEVACTRSFGHPVTELHELAEAITEFASRASQKLRKQGCLAGPVLWLRRWLACAPRLPARLQAGQGRCDAARPAA